MKRTLIDNLREPSPQAPPCGAPRRQHATRAADAAPVIVNGVRIDEASIAREAQHHPASAAAESRALAARALAIRALLLDRARELDLLPETQQDASGRLETEEEALIRQVIEQEAEIAEPTDDECRRYYLGAPALHKVQFEAIAPRIRDRLSARAWVTGATRLAAALARKAEIEGVEL